MRIFMLALVLAALPALCFAQDDAQAPAAPAASYGTYVAGDFGFSVDLPASGSVEDPQSEGWAEDPEVAFYWYCAEGDPVVMIQGRMDSFDTDLDAGDPLALGAAYAELRQRLPQLTVLGGCCGTDHRHVEQIAAACAREVGAAL